MATNWNKIVTAADWQAKALEFTTEAREAAKANDPGQMQAASDNLLEFLEQSDAACPDDVYTAVRDAQRELNRLIAADVVSSVKQRTVQLDAYLDDIRKAGERIKAQASLISLEPVRQAVDGAREIVEQVKTLRADIQAGRTPSELAASAKAIADGLASILVQLEKTLPKA